MNIYEMMKFIRENDNSTDRWMTNAMEFLNNQYLCSVITSEAFFYMLRNMTGGIVGTATYVKGESDVVSRKD